MASCGDKTKRTAESLDPREMQTSGRKRYEAAATYCNVANKLLARTSIKSLSKIANKLFRVVCRAQKTKVTLLFVHHVTPM